MKINRNRHRTTKWNLFFHYSQIGLAIISGVVLVPLYLRYIPVNQYGAWLATGNILAWITIIDPGISTVLQQRVGVAYGEGNIAEVNALFSGGILLSTVISCLIVLVGLLCKPFLFAWLNLSHTINLSIIEQAFWYAIWGSALMILFYGLSAFALGLQSSLGIGLIFVIMSIIGMIITVVLLFHGVGLLAIPIGNIVRGIGLLLGFAAYIIWRYKSGGMVYHVSLSGILKLTKQIGYTFLGRIATVLSTNMDAFVLTRYLGADVAPVFVFTRKAPEMSRMFLERPTNAVMPAISHLVGSGELLHTREVIIRLVRMILWLMGLVAVGFFVFNQDFVTLWVGHRFYSGNVVNTVISFWLIVIVIVNSLANLCFSLGNIKGNSVVTLIQGLISIALIMIGAKYWGMLGVALAPLLSMLVTSFWYFPMRFVQLLKLGRSDIKVFIREGIIVFVISIITTVSFYWVKVESWLFFVFAVTAFSAVYIIFLYIMSKAFRTDIGNIFKNKFWSIRC